MQLKIRGLSDIAGDNHVINSVLCGPTLVDSHLGLESRKWPSKRVTMSGVRTKNTFIILWTSSGNELRENDCCRIRRLGLDRDSLGSHRHCKWLRWHAVHDGRLSSHFFFRRRHVRHPVLVRRGDLAGVSLCRGVSADRSVGIMAFKPVCVESTLCTLLQGWTFGRPISAGATWGYHVEICAMQVAITFFQLLG